MKLSFIVEILETDVNNKDVTFTAFIIFLVPDPMHLSPGSVEAISWYVPRSYRSELTVIVLNRIQAFEAPIMLVPALSRLAGRQVQGIHDLPNDISLVEDALVSQKMKPLLPVVEDYSAPWRLLVH